MSTALSWTPARRGPIYCAPACGGGCTWVAYQLAMRRARAVAKRLGDGWAIDVHENLGWHAAVCGVDGFMRVTINTTGDRNKVIGYTAFLNTRPDAGGRWAEQGSSPERAIARVRAVFNAEKRELDALYERLADEAHLRGVP